MYIFSSILSKLLKGYFPSQEEFTYLITQSIHQKLDNNQITAWIVALQSIIEQSLSDSELKQELPNPEVITSIVEILYSFADILIQNSSLKNPVPLNSIDTCGTGGDGSEIINISTISSIVLASKGYPIAKHGNRSVSSKCGSADLLEKMQYPLNIQGDAIENQLKKNSFVFLFAPTFHPSMKSLASIRKSLGIRTIFNILGPLCNPQQPKVHLLGTFSYNYMIILSLVLQLRTQKEQHELPLSKAAVVYSKDGLDEISPIEDTHYCLVDQEKDAPIIGTFSPQSLNFSIKSIDEIKVLSSEDGFQKALQILQGKHLAGIEAIALNATACEYLYKYSQNNTPLSKESFQIYLYTYTPKMIDYIKSGAVSEYSQTLINKL